jgi:hypothetical protein
VRDAGYDVHVLFALILAAAPPANAIAISGTTGLAYSEELDPEGPYMGGLAFTGTRLDYNRAMGHGFYVGGLIGYDRTWTENRYTPRSNVGFIGPELGGRWGERIRGGIRVSGGFAYAGGSLIDSSFASPGWFVDLDAEITKRSVNGWDLFVSFPILWLRRFEFSSGPRTGKPWVYATPMFLPGLTIGFRHLF